MFNKLFEKKNEESKVEVFWNSLENESQLEEIKKISFEKPIAVFKHSTRCSISRMAWNQFQKQYTISSDKMEMYYLDLLEFRTISNAIVEQFQVQHQSPQILVIKNGLVVYHTSHESIDAKDLEEFVSI